MRPLKIEFCGGRCFEVLWRLAEGAAPFYTHSTVTRGLNDVIIEFTPGPKKKEGA